MHKVEWSSLIRIALKQKSEDIHMILAPEINKEYRTFIKMIFHKPKIIQAAWVKHIKSESSMFYLRYKKKLLNNISLNLAWNMSE